MECLSLKVCQRSRQTFWSTCLTEAKIQRSGCIPRARCWMHQARQTQLNYRMGLFRFMRGKRIKRRLIMRTSNMVDCFFTVTHRAPSPFDHAILSARVSASVFHCKRVPWVLVRLTLSFLRRILSSNIDVTLVRRRMGFVPSSKRKLRIW